MSPLKTLALLIIFAVSISISDGFEVSIDNRMGAGTVLVVHCKNNFEDLGRKELQYTAEYKWNFSIKTGTPVYYFCDFAMGSLGGSFNLFDEFRDPQRCGDEVCSWRAIDDGLYLYIKANDDYEKQFKWPNVAFAD